MKRVAVYPLSEVPFTFQTLKDAIPPYCFERSLVRSLLAVLRQVIYCSGLTWLAVLVLPMFSNGWFRVAAYLGYLLVQGCVLFGFWVLGHMSCHNGLSNWPLVDDLIGFVLHSVLLTPYYSMKYSHHLHHAFTGNVEKDAAWVPEGAEYAKSNEAQLKILNESPWINVFFLVPLILIGYPVYLCTNNGGQYKGMFVEEWNSHLNPFSPLLFPKWKQQRNVIITLVGNMTVLLLAVCAALHFGWTNVALFYALPVVSCNCWFVVVTMLQHLGSTVPHFTSKGWSRMRGALATIDRSYGVFFDHLLFHAGPTHVVHHLFPSLPHYHALEATAILRPLLGPYYAFDDTNWSMALWRNYVANKFVVEEDQEGVLWWRKK